MSTFYPENDYRTYLAHHGVKGMKWGVRHDPQRSNYVRFKRAIKDGSVRNGINSIGGKANKNFRSYVEETAKKSPSYEKMKSLAKQRNELWNQEYDLMLDIWNDDKECEKVFGKSQMDPRVSDSVAHWREYSKSGKGYDGKERKHATMEDWVQDEIGSYLKGERFAWNKNAQRNEPVKRDMSNANKSYMKRYESIQRDLNAIDVEWTKARDQVVDEMLGAYADTPISYWGYIPRDKKYGISSRTSRDLAYRYLPFD